MSIHQEDFCQARAIYPDLKYQNDGGPSVEDVTLIERLHDMTQRLETVAPAVANDLNKQGLSHPIVQTLADSISKRASGHLAHYF